VTIDTAAQQALEDYGRSGSATDGTFTSAILFARANRAHRYLADKAHLYRKDYLVDLPLGSTGYSEVTLNDQIIRIDGEVKRVQILSGSTWVPLTRRTEQELVETYGPLENAGNQQPHSYYELAGATSGKLLRIFPGATAAVTNGLRFPAWVYPVADLTTGQSFAFDANEHDHLIPVICMYMARLDRSRGRRDAPVADWTLAAEDSAAELKRKLADFRRGSGTRRVRMDKSEENYY
jgi:hypothetical protein